MASFIFRDRKSVSAVCGGDPDDKKNLRTTRRRKLPIGSRTGGVDCGRPKKNQRAKRRKDDMTAT
ncbi:hypothetical protein RUM43_013146 [Polyplax serrata]|uniref:Uncharacterized protein n=1 Tax=Polyplax serrata TaxID=468196 RepID=A0AAN8S017_POLSC